MKKKKKMTKVKGKGEVSMSLYEINQSIMSQMPPYNEEQIQTLIKNINDWDIDEHTRVKYYMLLNNEKHYYTILHYKDNTTHTDFRNLGDAIWLLFKEMAYDFVADEKTEDHYELWVKNDSETLCYMLFPYDQGVVTYG